MNVLQDLATETGAAAWAIASMLFFLAAWVAVIVWVVRKRPEDLDAQARLPLSDGTEGFRNQEAGSGQDQESGPTPES